MKSKFLRFTLPVLLFSFIWSAVEFLVPVLYSEKHITIEFVSILFAISSGISLILDIPAGKLSDRIGRERLITYSMIISAIALGLLYFFSSLFIFFITSILIGIAYGLNWSPLLAFVGDQTKDGDHGKVFAGFFTLEALAQAVAPLAIVLLLLNTSFVFPFLILALIALLCAYIFLRLIKNKSVTSDQETSTYSHFSYKSSIQIIKKSLKGNLFLLAIGFFVAFFWQSVWFAEPLIGFYENSLLDSALILGAFSLPNILFSHLFGKLIDKVGEKKVFFFSLITIVASFIAFYFSISIVTKIIFIFIAATGVLGVWLVLDVLVVKTNKKEERGEFFGILETVRDGSYAVAPLFIGVSYKFIGLSGIFVVNSLFAILLLLFGIRLFKKLNFQKGVRGNSPQDSL